MKKKLYSLQRWLNRLTVACSRNELTSAMAEADLLSAELEEVRDELWCKVEGESVTSHWERKLVRAIPRLSAIVLISLFIVCTAICSITQDVTQLANNGGVNIVSNVSTGSSKHKTTSRTLASPVNRLFTKTRENTKTLFTLDRVRQAKSSPEVASVKSVTSHSNDEKQKSSEVLLTLVQIGEQSLRNSSGAKFIIKTNTKLQSKEHSL